MQEIVISGFKKTKSKWCGTDPWTIAFVYTPHCPTGFVVKGMSGQVRSFIEQRYPKYIARFTYWQNGTCKVSVGWRGEVRTRGTWHCSPGIYIFEKSRGHKRFEITVREGKKTVHEFKVRRVPRRWLAIYNQASKYE
jgi:hypothetical protein